MDTVIFTGRVSLEELQHERPAQYERLLRENRLAALEVPPAPPRLKRLGYVVGTTAIVFGLLMVTLTVRALLRD
jgi:hypothetical protein